MVLLELLVIQNLCEIFQKKWNDTPSSQEYYWGSFISRISLLNQNYENLKQKGRAITITAFGEMQFEFSKGKLRHGVIRHRRPKFPGKGQIALWRPPRKRIQALNPPNSLKLAQLMEALVSCGQLVYGFCGCKIQPPPKTNSYFDKTRHQRALFCQNIPETVPKEEKKMVKKKKKKKTKKNEKKVTKLDYWIRKPKLLKQMLEKFTWDANSTFSCVHALFPTNSSRCWPLKIESCVFQLKLCEERFMLRFCRFACLFSKFGLLDGRNTPRQRGRWIFDRNLSPITRFVRWFLGVCYLLSLASSSVQWERIAGANFWIPRCTSHSSLLKKKKKFFPRKAHVSTFFDEMEWTSCTQAHPSSLDNAYTILRPDQLWTCQLHH